MEKKTDTANRYDEDGEKRLAELIKKAGNNARMRKKKTMEQHYAKIQSVIGEAVSERQRFITK